MKNTINNKHLIIIILIIHQDTIFGLRRQEPSYQHILQNLPKLVKTSVKETLLCNRTLTEKDSEIWSPGYGLGYPSNLKCFWFINVKHNNSIRLKFHDFHLEHHRDFLAIYDGNSSAGMLLGNYTGDELPPALISSTNNLFLNFTTDNVVNKTGFNITFQTVKFGCGGQLDEKHNAIFSPGYPEHYPDNITCIWNITVPKNKFIVLNIHDLETDENDVLTVYDQVHIHPSYGRIPLSDSALAHFSNSLLLAKHKTLISKRNQLFLEFKSNEKKTGKGFAVYYHTKDMGMESPILISVPFGVISISLMNSLYPVQTMVYSQGLQTSQLIDYDSDQQNLLYFRPEINELVLKNEIGIHDDIHFTLNSIVKTHAMTIDWIHSLVYWIDIRWHTINVFHMSQKHDQNIYAVCNISTMGDPGDLVFNRLERVLVWTIIGEPYWQNIMYANSDGSNQRILHYGYQKQPFHLTIDYEKQNYYFIDITDYSLYSIDFKGQNERFYMKSEKLFQSINTMLVMDNDLYLSDEHRIYRIPELKDRIQKAEILYNTNSNIKSKDSHNFYEFNPFKLSAQKIFGFRLKYPSFNINTEKNHCRDSNCSNLCLPTTISFRCICPSGYNVEHNKSCVISSIRRKPYRKVERHSDKHSIVNSLLIALLFVLILLFYVSFKLKKLRQDQISEHDKSKRVRLRLIMKDDQDDGVRYEDDL